jgi:carbon-monoxide dehydrogenase small subunit
MSEARAVTITINGRAYEGTVEPRRTLADFIREEAGLKGTHLACEHGFCGNCNVVLDGDTIRSCLMFAVQADGHEVETVEALCAPGGALSEIQQAFTDHAAVQCGFCTPAMLLTAREFLRDHPGETREEVIREGISSVTCRCTGYQQIVDAIRSLAVAS